MSEKVDIKSFALAKKEVVLPDGATIELSDATSFLRIRDVVHKFLKKEDSETTDFLYGTVFALGYASLVSLGYIKGDRKKIVAEFRDFSKQMQEHEQNVSMHYVTYLTAEIESFRTSENLD